MAAGPKVLYEFGPFRIDPDKGLLLREDQPVPITPKAFQTLLILVQRSRETVSKDELMKLVWPDAFVEEGNLSQNIFVLRKALGDTPEDRRYIVTSPGQGYRFSAQVRIVAPDEDGVSAPARPLSQLTLKPEEIPSATTGLPSSKNPGRALRWAYLVGFLVIVVLATVLFLRYRVPVPVPEGTKVLIGHIASQNGDQLPEATLRVALRLRMAQSPFFDLIPERHIFVALNDRRESELSGQNGPGICKQLSGAVQIAGTVATEPNGNYALELNATRCIDGRAIVRERAEAVSRDGVFAALDRAADALRVDLGETAASVQKFRFSGTEAGTNSLAAFEAFSRGEQKRAQGEDLAAAPLYKMAADLDPNFALAYARLGTIYSNAQEDDSGQKFFARAFELRDHTGERERLYITAHYHSGISESDKAAEVYELWRQLYPRDLVPPNNLVEVYFTLGQPEKALSMAQDAVRLGPDNATPHASLIRAYQRNGKFVEAKALYDELVARKFDGIVPHLIRTMIAGAENDEAEVQRQLEWAKGREQESDILNQAALIALGRGEFQRAQKLLDQVQVVANKNHLPQFGVSCLREYSESAAEVGFATGARSYANRTLRSDPDSRGVLASAAIVFARTGDLRRSNELASRAAQRYPSDFGLNRLLLPTARAVADLQSGDPGPALRRLEEVTPYDLSWETELSPIYYRGLTYLKLKRPNEAETQFQKLLDHRAFRPDSIYIPLANLGLARAAVMKGDRGKAKARYEAFFEIWKHADPDIPILREAKSEFAKIK